MKNLKDMTFDEVVDLGVIQCLQFLMKGEFRVGVYIAMDLALRWREETR